MVKSTVIKMSKKALKRFLEGKKKKRKKLTQDELAIYWEIMQDVKKYPQKKMVKGKEKNKIQLSKHETMYESQMKAFNRLPKSDFIKKYPRISTELPTLKKALK